MAPNLAAGDGHLVDLVWPISKAKGPDVTVHVSQRGELGNPGGTVDLFRLRAVRIRRNPGRGDLDNARYVLYETSGGYPIGIFGMFVRSRIADRGEQERSQVLFAVGFNFYGRKDWPHRRVINPIWEWVHNRATSNILNRFKRVCEASFRELEE